MTHHYIINIMLRSIDLEDNIVAQIPLQVATDLGDYEDLAILGEYLTEEVERIRNPYATAGYQIVVIKPETAVDLGGGINQDQVAKALATLLKQQLPAINAELVSERHNG